VTFDPKTQELPPGIVQRAEGVRGLSPLRRAAISASRECSFYELKGPRRTRAESLSKDLGEASPWFANCGPSSSTWRTDFNTGGAIGVLYDLLNRLEFAFADEEENRGGAAPRPMSRSFLARASSCLRELSQILGLFREPPRGPGAAATIDSSPAWVQLLIDLAQRGPARQRTSRWATRFAKRLASLKITLEEPSGWQDPTGAHG